MALVTVTISDRGDKQLIRIRTTPDMDRGDIANKAVEKIFGRRHYWFPDSGLPGYGQVFEALRPTRRNSEPGNSARTGRVHLDISE